MGTEQPHWSMSGGTQLVLGASGGHNGFSTGRVVPTGMWYCGGGFSVLGDVCADAPMIIATREHLDSIEEYLLKDCGLCVDTVKVPTGATASRRQPCDGDVLIREFRRSFPAAFDRAALQSEPPTGAVLNYLARLREETVMTNPLWTEAPAPRTRAGESRASHSRWEWGRRKDIPEELIVDQGGAALRKIHRAVWHQGAVGTMGTRKSREVSV